MKDFLGLYIAPVAAWIIAAIDWNEITVAGAAIASAASALAAVSCGISKALTAREHRKGEINRREAEEYMLKCQMMLARDRVCDECLKDGGVFVNTCNFKFHHLNCPKEKREGVQ